MHILYHSIAFHRAKEPDIARDGGAGIYVKSRDGVSAAIECAIELSVLGCALAAYRHPRPLDRCAWLRFIAEGYVTVESYVFSLVVVVAPIHHVGKIGKLLRSFDYVRIALRATATRKHLRWRALWHTPLFCSQHRRRDECGYHHTHHANNLFHFFLFSIL